jgi:hypothetical protein
MPSEDVPSEGLPSTGGGRGGTVIESGAGGGAVVGSGAGEAGSGAGAAGPGLRISSPRRARIRSNSSGLTSPFSYNDLNSVS